MRQFFLGLSLLITFVAGCVAAHLAQLVVPPAQAENGPLRYQHTCMTLDGDMPAVNAVLNDWGREGWELVSFFPGAGTVATTACLKRTSYRRPPSMSAAQPTAADQPSAAVSTTPAIPSGK